MKYPPKDKSKESGDPDSRDSSKQFTSARSGNSEQVMCVRSRDPVPLPVWLSPSEHSEIERRRYSEMIYSLRGETIYNRLVMLKGVRQDLKTGHKAVTIRGLSMTGMIGQLNDIMDKQPIKFLRMITRKHEKLQTQKDQEKLLTQRGKKEMVNMVVNLMKGMRLVETGKRQAPGTELLLTLMSSPVLQKTLSVTGVKECDHISRVTPDRVWVSDRNNLILTDTKTDTTWEPLCVYCSPSSGDLLVGMCRDDTYTRKYTGKVMRCDNTGKRKQTIPHNDYTCHDLYELPLYLYGYPWYITENNNGDVLVSDWDRGAVVVTSGEGVYRFFYTGPPSGSRLRPTGICTDVMSHILVSDYKTSTVQMLDRDGQFLSYLLTTQSPGILNRPEGLSYDITNHILYVGSYETLSVYRYINRLLALSAEGVHQIADQPCQAVSPGVTEAKPSNLS
ncbi:uncharacterized protein LOC111133287 [Crassostrea virginica]